ncbi:hypothetical protein F4553_003570 [Allocatelliglobosispora scoriae]|uniref:Uncharacterized protein n=1 Tax=Allocatelliglobosispora scoriae TaxID=643052 RepID=A0A841BTT7_9ACTN|nr:hypothetical protein [Allocatelliglobosispora scoriae]
MDRLSVLLALARVLRVGDIGGFLGSALPQAAPLPPPDTRVGPLRDLLYAPAPLPVTAADQDRRALDSATAAWTGSERPYYEALRQLPPILIEVPGDELAAGAYRLAAEVLRHLDELPLSLLAAERAVAAARRHGEPLGEAESIRGFAETLLRLRHPAQAQRLCLDAVTALRARRPESDAAGGDALGGLYLTAAEGAIVDGDHAAGVHLMGTARLAARRPETEAQVVRLTLLLGRTRPALRLAETVDAEAIAGRSARARHYITVARAHAGEDSPEAVVFALGKAEIACAEELRFNTDARSTIRDLLERPNALIRADVLALAERCGLL